MNLYIEEEKKYLSRVIDKINYELQSSTISLGDSNKNIYELKKYIWENITEMDPSEIINLEMAGLQDETKAIFAKRRLDILYRIKSSPYFGRIDFYDEAFNELINVYIGLTSIKDNDEIDFLVYDWRSPISSLYYEFGLGKAEYNTPAGKQKGELKLKRQYKIKNGELNYIIDNDLNIEDDLLKEALGKY